jgi:hypothetical protein
MAEPSLEWQITLQGCQYLRMPFASEEKGNKMEVKGLPLEVVTHIGC